MTKLWWDELVALWWPGDHGLPPTPEVRGWLTSKHEIALVLCPGTIGEIGVRAGYSAFAMLSAVPSASYIGFDVGWPSRYLTDLGALEREQGALDHGRAILSPRFNASIIEVDSHMVLRVPPFDLLHIDGDHTFGGLTADLELAWRSGVKRVLVDDYLVGCVVKAGTDAWAGSKGIPVESIDDGFRGSALLDLRAATGEIAYEDGTRQMERV